MGKCLSIAKATLLNENFGQVQNSVEEYGRHLEAIYEMQMFYGDENLQKLIEHSRELRQDLSDFQNKYSE